MTPVFAGGIVAALGPARFDSGLAWVTVACCVLACVPAGLRWLRVAQREHYLGGTVSVFARRWWSAPAVNVALGAVAIAAGAASLAWPLVGVVTAAAVVAGPVGLGVRGRTSPLAWTRRLRTLALVWAVLEAVVIVVGIVLGVASPLAVAAALAVPVLVDLACVMTAPVEMRASAHFVDEAAARLARVSPTVVAVTGSYGKTSTKGHIAHLVGPSRSVVATPASFNNRAGLARSINEHLTDGTEVFVAEMGTYGPGEIADLCRWCVPDIGVITAIGPVHLERFGTEERIVEAKSEILARAQTAVLPVDDPRLAGVADRAATEGKAVVRCSSADRSVDVAVTRGSRGLSITVHGNLVAEDVLAPAGVQPTNVACAVAVATQLGVDEATIAARLATLPAVDHRLKIVSATTGAAVLDDTYNSNPAGAARALRALTGDGAGTIGAADGRAASGAVAVEDGRRVVVTPGMVELGSRQFEENHSFAAAIAREATDLVVVGRTNRRALLAGVASVAGSTVAVHVVDHRDDAVTWVRDRLGPGDRVLYENDLPDHYP